MASLRRISLALLLLGCGAGAPPPPERPAPRAPRLGALLSLVPPDATVLVVARPTALLEAEPTRRLVEAVFSESQLDLFRARTGIDPRELEEVVFVEHPDGRIVMVRGPIDAPFAVREAGERMAPLESSVDEPVVRRAGFLGSRRSDVAALAEDVVVWVDGTPQLAAAVLASARRAQGDRVDPLGGASADIRRELSSAPLVLYAPRPLGLPGDTGVGVLLAREEALGASMTAADGELLLRAELRGEFPPNSHENFRALAESLAASDFGAALGARDALPSLRIQTEDGRVSLRAEVPPQVLVSGLRALLVAEMQELLEIPEPETTP